MSSAAPALTLSAADPQAAVKYGTREPGFPCPKTGALRWKFTFADVVYVTDETCRLEITSWPAPGAGFDVPLVEISAAMAAQHAAAAAALRDKPASWTSHTVLVVDQSGSMRKMDVSDGATRSDAVWVTLAATFVREQLETGALKGTDAVTVIGMNAESTLLVDRQPADWVLFNALVMLLRTAQPKQASAEPVMGAMLPVTSPQPAAANPSQNRQRRADAALSPTTRAP